MPHRLGFFLLITILAVVGCAREERPGPQVRVMPNGLTVIARENRGADVVSVQAWVREGTLYETAQSSGTAYVLTRTLLSQSESRGPHEIARAIEAVGGVMAGIPGQDNTHFTVTVPAGQFDLAVDLLADALLHPVFDAADVERAKGEARKGLEALAERPIDQAHLLCLRTIANDHPISRPVLGAPAAVAALDAGALKARYLERYVGANMAVVVVGNVDPRVAADKVEKTFAGLRQGAPAEPVARSIAWPEKPLRVREQAEVKRAYMVIGFPGPGVKDDDHLAADVLMMALANGRASRLNRLLVDEKGLAGSVGGGWYTRPWPSPCFVWMELPAENVQAAEAAVVELVSSLARETPTAEDLERGKALLASYATFQDETCEQQASFEGYWFTVAGTGYSDSYLERVAAVTAEDLRKAAASYLRPEARATAVLEPAWVR